jgi:hypothetical protein
MKSKGERIEEKRYKEMRRNETLRDGNRGKGKGRGERKRKNTT